MVCIAAKGRGGGGGGSQGRWDGEWEEQKSKTDKIIYLMSYTQRAATQPPELMGVFDKLKIPHISTDLIDLVEFKNT